LILTGVCATVAAADRETESLIREVTAGAKSDAERAEKLVAAANLAEGNQPLLVALYDRAVEFGMKAPLTGKLVEKLDGALGQLIAKDADRAEHWRERRMTLYRTWYRRAKRKDKLVAGRELVSRLLAAAKQHEQADRWDKAAATYTEAGGVAATIRHPNKDEITEAGVRSRHFAGVRRKVAGYERIVASNPDNTAARKALLVALTVDLDDPAAATKHLTDAVGEVWNTYLPMAAGPVGKLDANGCKELGTWYYREMTKKAGDRGKANALYRANIYYERFLRLHGKKDVASLKAQVALKDIRAEIGRLAGENIRPLARMRVPTGVPRPVDPVPPVVAAGEWIDLLQDADPKKVVGEGKGKRTPDGIVLESSSHPARLVLPAMCPESFDLRIEFTTTRGKGGCVVLFPVKDRGCRLNLGGWGNTLSGLSMVKGRSVSHRDGVAVKGQRITPGKRHAAYLRLELLEADRVKIAVRLDDKDLLSWSGPRSDLSLSEEDRKLGSPGRVVLGANHTKIVYHSVRIRPLAPVAPSSPSGTASGEWVDALRPVDVTKHRVEGEAKRLDDGAIHLQPTKSGGRPRVMIPVRPAGSYDFTARFVRKSGDEKIGFILPTGRTAVQITFSHAKGTAHGLSRINEKSASDNGAAVRPGKLVNNKAYAVAATVRIQGDRVSIEASLDGKTLIRWQGPQSALDLHPANRLPDPHCMGLIAACPTVFRSVKIRTIDGEAAPVPPAPVRPPGRGKVVGVDKLAELKGHSNHVRSLAFDPSGQTLASVAVKEKTVRLWDLTAKKPQGVLTGHGAPVMALAISADGILASAGVDKAVALWDLRTGKLTKALKGHGETVRSVAFSPSGQLLATGTEDKTVCLWDVRTGKPRHVLKGHVSPALLLAFDAEGKTLVSFARGEGNKGRRWDVLTGQQRGLLDSLRSQKSPRAAITPNATTIAQVSGDAPIAIRDIVRPPEPRKRKAAWHGRRCSALAFSRDGRLLASGGNEELSSKECFVKLWDARTGQVLVKPFDKQKNGVASLAFSPDGQFLAVGRGNGTITLWKLRYEAPPDSAAVEPPKPPAAGKTTVVKVLPQNWQRFVEVKKGQKLSLTAEGQWQGRSAQSPTGPEGTIGGGKKKPVYYLEARVAGKTHKVGKGTTILVEKDGWLEMRMMRLYGPAGYKKYGPQVTGFMTVTIEEK